MRETLRFAGKIVSATTSRVADRWFANTMVDMPDLSHLPKPKTKAWVASTWWAYQRSRRFRPERK